MDAEAKAAILKVKELLGITLLGAAASWDRADDAKKRGDIPERDMALAQARHRTISLGLELIYLVDKAHGNHTWVGKWFDKLRDEVDARFREENPNYVGP